GSAEIEKVFADYFASEGLASAETDFSGRSDYAAFIAAGIPAGVKATTEWFPAKERSVAIGWFNIGSSIGALCAPPLVVWAILHAGWQWAFVIVGVLGVAWTLLWVVFYKHPRDQKRLSDAERDYILSGQEARHQENAPKASWRKIVRDRGRALGDLSAQVQAWLDREAGNAELKEERALLQSGLEDAGRIVAVMIGDLQAAGAPTGAREVYKVGLNTTRL
ncbi:MAG: MFS transporter, partial [Gammaproteobacteria bacterium]